MNKLVERLLQMQLVVRVIKHESIPLGNHWIICASQHKPLD
jgi:hypothetical protein